MRFKKPLVLLVIIVVALVPAIQPIGVSATDYVVKLTAKSGTVTEGGSTVISIQTTDVPDLYGYSFMLVFDPAYLELQPSVEGVASGAGLALGTGALIVINEETSPGRVEVAATRSGSGAGVAGKGTLAEFQFKALKIGVTTVQLEEVVLANSGAEPIAGVTGSGTKHNVTITGGQPGPEPDPGEGSGDPGPGTGSGSGPGPSPGAGANPGSQPGPQPGTQSGTQSGNSTSPRDNDSNRPVINLGQGADAASRTSTDESTGRVTVTVSVDQAKARNMVDKMTEASVLQVRVEERGDTAQVEMGGSLIQLASQRRADLEVVFGGASFRIPAQAIDLNALAAAFAGNLPTLDQMTVRLVIETPSAEAVAAATNRAETEGLQTVSLPVEFRIEVIVDGKIVTTNRYGRSFAERTIPLTRSVDPLRSTGAYFDGTTYHHVPTMFADGPDGGPTAVLRRNADSVYVVVEQSRTFADIRNHWARTEIESMASKLIVSGQGPDRFNPDGNVTRAEFAALLVRALGFEGQKPPTNAPSFKDVVDGDWYRDAVRLASLYGLVNGYTDGTFAPNAPIRRQELAVMVDRAMELAVTPVPLQSEQVLSRLVDSSSIESWARTAVARTLEARILSGYADGTFLPGASATRAESVVMLNRLLTAVEWMNAAEEFRGMNGYAPNK